MKLISIIVFILITSFSFSDEIIYDNSEHEVRVLNSAFDSLRARIDAIRSAETEIDIEFFIFNQDHVGRILLNEILEKKKANPKIIVRILIDHYGSKSKEWEKSSLQSLLKNYGIETRYYNPGSFVLHPKKYNRRDHRKLFIIDRKKMIVGGRNIADDYFDLEKSGFIDRDLFIQGKIVNKVAESFEKFWRLKIVKPIAMSDRFDESLSEEFILTKDELEILNNIEEKASRTELPKLFICNELQFVSDGSLLENNNRNRHTRDELQNILSSAKLDVYIENYLFIPEEDRQDVLYSLSSNGVKIHAITNGIRGGEWQAFFLSHLKARKAIKKNMDVYEYEADPLDTQSSLDPKQELSQNKWKIHTKNFIIDFKDTIIGSHNLDPRSANINVEDFIVIHNQKDFAHEVALSFKEREHNSKKLCDSMHYCDGSKVYQDVSYMVRLQLKAIFPFLKLFENQF